MLSAHHGFAVDNVEALSQCIDLAGCSIFQHQQRFKRRHPFVPMWLRCQCLKPQPPSH